MFFSFLLSRSYVNCVSLFPQLGGKIWKSPYIHPHIDPSLEEISQKRLKVDKRDGLKHQV